MIRYMQNSVVLYGIQNGMMMQERVFAPIGLWCLSLHSCVHAHVWSIGSQPAIVIHDIVEYNLEKSIVWYGLQNSIVRYALQNGIVRYAPVGLSVFILACTLSAIQLNREDETSLSLDTSWANLWKWRVAFRCLFVMRARSSLISSHPFRKFYTNILHEFSRN